MLVTIVLFLSQFRFIGRRRANSALKLLRSIKVFSPLSIGFTISGQLGKFTIDQLGKFSIAGQHGKFTIGQLGKFTIEQFVQLEKSNPHLDHHDDHMSHYHPHHDLPPHPHHDDGHWHSEAEAGSGKKQPVIII